MLNLTNIAAWTHRLRFGNDPQDGSCLRSKTGFCCLGVAEDMSESEWTEPVFGNHIYQVVLTNGTKFSAYLSPYGMAFLGTIDENPYLDNPAIIGPDGMWSLNPNIRCGTLNDTDKFTFPQIADLIDYFGLVR